LTINDLKTFHSAYVAPELAYMVVVGQIDKAALQKQLETAFANWKPGKSKIQTITDAQPTKGRTIYLIDKPGLAQTEIRVGCVGVKRSNPDYYAITVMNTILGGSFTSRLNNNLREQKGYTYGAFSRFGMFLSKGSFTVSTSVQTEVTDKALTEIMKELTNIITISDDDLNKAKNYVALSYPSDFEGVQNMAAMIDDKVFYGLPDSYFNDYTKNILAVTMDDVKRAAQNYVQPENMVIVLVGDRSKIEAGVKALKLGKIINLKREDVLGKMPKV
jgi:predicted Zn-dependent peptidase